MPRGFLVKRNRRIYRSRKPEPQTEPWLPPEPSPPPPPPFPPPNLTFPTGAQLFPSLSPDRKCSPYFESGRKLKKIKTNRKLNFEDDVTTSPVLGLRIKKGTPPAAPASNPLLGGFTCQLCREEYPDPFALAQHRCSRIVRVEYRCPECAKVFSCPANLASHRRWHRPRAHGGEKHAQQLQGKENEALLLLRADARPPYGSAAASGEDARHTHDEEEEETGELYACAFCGKKFRRQAYLRKHVAAHEASARPGTPPPPQPPPPQQVFLCHLCGARFPTPEIRDKHALWHAVREELQKNEQQIFSCKFCTSTFFSLAGLSGHVARSHPAGHVMLMHVSNTYK